MSDLVRLSHEVEGLAGVMIYWGDTLTREEAETIAAFARAVRPILEAREHE